MHTAADTAQEKQELEVVLASGIFHRAPNLAQLLTYVCTKHFEGSADQIKEYNIAVDALGRPADFDQKRDSIVRVEAHRLRKRLREYYETDGANHALRIDIPPGQYAPRFVPLGMPVPSLVSEALVLQPECASPAIEPVPVSDPPTVEVPVALLRTDRGAAVSSSAQRFSWPSASERSRCGMPPGGRRGPLPVRR